MNWLGRWLLKIIQKSQETDPDRAIGTLSTSKLARSNDINGDEGLNIQVRKAIGGRIVSFQHYDQKTDRHYWKTYIIPDDLDFEPELGKMITLESMRG